MNAFESLPVINPFETDISERQIKMTQDWRKKRAITAQEFEKRGVRLDQLFIQRAKERKQNFSGMMKRTEEGAMAEVLMLEGADEEGVTKNPPHWFGELVFAYPPIEADDIFLGCDAILMFPDERDERRAHPVSIDMKTNPIQFDEIVTEQMSRLAEKRPHRVHWVDTSCEPDASSFDSPKPGSVEAIALSAYIPSRIVTTLRSNKMTQERVDQVMVQLGIGIRAQMQYQLETAGHVLLGDAHVDAATRRIIADNRRTRGELIRALGELARNAEDLTTRIRANTIINTLKRIWDEQKDQLDAPLLNAHREMLPPILDELPGCIEEKRNDPPRRRTIQAA